MSIDLEGTTPGLAPATTPQKVLNMRCRNERCDSIEAVEVPVESLPHAGHRVYRCLKCGHTRPLSVGGHLNI